MWIIVVLAAVAVVFVVGLVWYRAANTKKVGANEALIVSGRGRYTVEDRKGNKREVGYRIQIGGSAFVSPISESAEALPLDIFSVTVKTPEVLTRQGVLISAEANGQVKVASDDYSISLAAEQFLGQGRDGITQVAHEVLEGHLRAAIGTMTVEQIYTDRAKVAAEVRHAAEADFGKMGLELVAFSLKDISDSQGYIAALGVPQIVRAREQAEIARAETERELAVKSAEAKKEGDVARLVAETAVAQATRDFESHRAEFQATINQKRAQADAAYELERNKMASEIKKSEYDLRLFEKQKAIELEEKEIMRREKELEATVKKPAEAMSVQSRIEAEADAYRKELEAKGKAAGVRLDGAARADSLRAQGQAEAESLGKKAEAYAHYNRAAMLEMMVKVMPELARAVSEPLSKVEKIVMVGNGENVQASKLTGQVTGVLSQLPTLIEALTGVDLRNVIEGRLAAPAAGSPPGDGGPAPLTTNGKRP
ncbi:MAG TPA: SPFH domain-containing protein [Polyangia bacterium]|jgi:flotillin